MKKIIDYYLPFSYSFKLIAQRSSSRLLILLFFLSPFALHAQNAGEGDTTPAWRQALGGAVIGLPTVQAQSAVVVCDGGNVKAYSTKGTPLWNYYARGRVSPFITRSPEGTSYISRTNGIFIAVNRAGRELWRITPGGALSSQAIPGWDGRLFIPTGKKISCYTGSGNPLWQKTFENPIALGPKLDREGGILLVLDTGELLLLDPFGKTYSQTLPEVPAEILSIGVPGEKSRIMVFYKSGAAEIIDPASVNPKPYTLPRLPYPLLAGVSRENSAAVVLNNGQVLRISGKDGSFLWTADSHLKGNAGTNDVSMLYDDRGIYVLSKSGATGFTEDGRRLWVIHLDGAAAIPAFGDDGILYSGGTDWILYAYKLEERLRLQKQSLYGPVPDGTYGT
ncbi:MAG: PQQ-like beta-propeller repeat protein, partial [Treponema sp.]|nr:PQQ-like beta-propeller repeat protein [Treponema sp.]